MFDLFDPSKIFIVGVVALIVIGPKELPRVKVLEGPKDQPPYAHPYYWAGFVLVGDPDYYAGKKERQPRITRITRMGNDNMR